MLPYATHPQRVQNARSRTAAASPPHTLHATPRLPRPPSFRPHSTALSAATDSPPSSASSTATTTAVANSTPAAAAAAAPPSPPPGPSKEAILSRIARAKQYKQPSGGEASGAAGASTTAEGPASEAVPTEGALTSPGAAARAAALPRVGPTKVDWGAVVGFLDAPVSTERTGGTATPVTYGGTAPVPAAEEDAAAAAEREERFMTAPEQKDYMAMLMNSRRRDGAGSATRAADALAGVLAAPQPYDGDGAGGDMAGGDGDGGVISPNMRMEEFTAAKEARLRALGGEVITADPSYNPGGSVSVRVSMGDGAGMMAGPEAVAAAEARRAEAEAAAERRAAEEAAAAAARAEAEAREAAASAAGAEAEAGSSAPGSTEEDVYKPKVSTWGMFPRPKDISEAYGGGRNLKPGQALETPQQKAEREKSYAAALAAYKARAGLEVAPEAEERAAKLYDEGMELFFAGQLKDAYDKFDKVLAAVPVKTKYGGLATLQKAIVLDSVGQSDTAQKLYKSIATHSVAQVSKKAKQMLFGFEAMIFMKADQFNYGVKKADYDKYFRGSADRRTLYVATAEELRKDEEAARKAGLVGLLVILAPVLAVAFLAMR